MQKKNKTMNLIQVIETTKKEICELKW